MNSGDVSAAHWLWRGIAVAVLAYVLAKIVHAYLSPHTPQRVPPRLDPPHVAQAAPARPAPRKTATPASPAGFSTAPSDRELLLRQRKQQMIETARRRFLEKQTMTT